MEINYWVCEFQNAEETYDNEHPWCYFCNHTDNNDGLCTLDNKFNDRKVNCILLDISK